MYKGKSMGRMPHHSFRLLFIMSLCRGSGASLVRIRSASSRWRVSCTDGTTHEGRGRFSGRLAARDDSLCTLSFDFRAKDGLDVAPAAIVSSSHARVEPLAAPEEGGEELEAVPSHPRRRTALNSLAMNQTDSSRGCSDFPLPFVENPSPVTLLGGNCSTTIALSSHLFPAFASGIPSVCRASYEAWVQQTGLFQISPSPPPLAYGVTDPSAPMAELCAATCAAASVPSFHCAVPSPPPTQPPVPPSMGGFGNGSHTIEATTVEQLHQALSTGYSRGRVDIRVPAGAVLHLEGRLLLVDGINVTIRSDGGEAVLDSQGRSRLFEVLSGGSLLLESVRLLNGWADMSGGALMVRGAAATLIRCSLLNSSSEAAGGAAIVLDGELLLLDCLVRGSSSTYGGAFYVNGASAVFLQHSVVSMSSAAQFGGVIYSVGNSNTAFVIACDISDSTAAFGGAVYAWFGSSVSISSKSKISHSSAFMSGGVFFARAVVVSLSNGCLISHSRANVAGGVLAGVVSFFIVNNCTIEYSTVSVPLDGGGALWLHVSSYCAISNYSTIAHSAALGESSEGGAIYLSSSTLEISLGCFILHSTAAMGGAIFGNAGNLRVVDACVIANSASTQDGGAIHITSSNVIISGGSKILDSTATNSGGAFYINSGVVLLSDGTSVANSKSTWQGGAIFALDSTVTIRNRCVIANSDSAVGGALNLANTIFLMTTGSTIVNSTAVTNGGAVALYGGSFVLARGSTLSYSASANDGGAILIGGTNSVCNLTDAVIEASTSSGRGSVFDIVDANHPLLILTFVEIKQYACHDGLFSVSPSTLSEAVVLQNVTLTHAKCTATPVEPTPASSLGCGDKFIFREQERGVCASAKADACYEEALPVASLKSVTWYAFVCLCDSLSFTVHIMASEQRITVFARTLVFSVFILLFGMGYVLVHPNSFFLRHSRCPWPEYPDPDLEERLAPYLDSGCIRPMQLTGITVVSEKVAVTMQKPENMEGHVNLTLQIEGTDNARPAVWRLLNTSSLLLRSPWLRLPNLSGTVYPQSISSGITFVLVPLTFSASGLLERAALYEERLTVDVRSEINLAATTHMVDVSLSVQARTSFVVWGSVQRQRVVQLKCEVQKLQNQVFLVGAPQRQSFTACDVDSLPVEHLLPLQRDPRRFRAVMSTSADHASELGLSYVGAGVYDISFAIPTWGATHIRLFLDETQVESLAGNATCPLYWVSLPDGRCGCSAGFFRTLDAVECAPCQQGRTSLPGAQRAEDCSLCADGFYRPSVHSLSSACVSCLAGANCTSNATLQSLVVLDGFWRLSDSSTELLPCPNGRGAICVGGNQTGRCAPAFTGPLCKVCSRSGQYFVDGECLDCPDATGRLFMAVGIAGALVTIFVLAQLWNSQCNHCRNKPARETLKWSHVLLSAMPSAVQLRILLSFYQCVTAVGDVYSIDFDSPYLEFLNALDWIRVDWLSILMPAPCVGRVEHRILLVALAPFGAMAFGAVLQLLLSKASGAPLTRGVSAGTSLCLFVVFLLSPQITQAIFEAFQCVPFEWSPTVTHYYMRSSLSVQCYTFDHDRIVLISYVLMVVWPIGSVLLFFSLVYRARSRLIEHIRDEFVVSIRLLHNDYKPESFFWASVELVHRSILIGWVLLIDEEKSFLRLVVANIICVVMLMWTSTALPYLRMHDNVLCIAAALLLQLTYIWSSYVKVLHALKDYEAPDAEKSISSRVLGFESSNEITITLLFLGGSLLGIFLTLCTHRLQTQQWGHHLRLKESGVPPEISLSMGKRWMLFISHVWRTGQDQAAYIKRQLQRMLPSIPIFLDVDDLVSIDLLEEYIDASGAVHTRLALCLVWEADHAKGGAPLQYLRDHECPQDLVEVLFGEDGKIIQWHRQIEFQLLTLKKIAEAALLASPAYSHKKSLLLSVHGEVAVGVKNRAPRAVYVYASSSNAGARTFAQELQEGNLSNLFIAEKMPSEADWHGSRTMVHFLLYLSKYTFAGNSGSRLAAEIRMARARRIPFVLVHEQDVARGGCEFSWVLDSTPQDLVQDGLYKEQLAVALMRGDHREVSFALVARRLLEQGSERRRKIRGGMGRLSLIKTTYRSLRHDKLAVGTVIQGQQKGLS